MDLSKILEKTKTHNLSIKDKPVKIAVADQDRPYDFSLKDEKPKKMEVMTGAQQLDNKLTTKKQQTDNKLTTKKQQTNNKLTTKKQQTDNKLATKKQQTNNKEATVELREIGETALQKITGIQKNILVFFFLSCIKKEGYDTGEISIKQISEALLTTIKIVKTSVYRLEKKGCVIRECFKNGRGGWTQYSIPKYIYNELYKIKNLENLPHPLKNIYNKLTTNPLLSSSSINTTTYLYENINLENIKNALKLPHIPNGQFFDKGNLKAVFNANGGELTPKQIQLSIDSFAYGLEHHFNESPYNTMKEPGAVLFKKLKHGDAWDEPRYLTPSEQEVKKYYDNLCFSFAKNEKQYFETWLKTNRDEMLKKFKAKLSSTYHLSDSEFMEKAVKEFKANILPELKVKHALEIFGEDKKELLQKIERL